MDVYILPQLLQHKGRNVKPLFLSVLGLNGVFEHVVHNFLAACCVRAFRFQITPHLFTRTHQNS
jgi:hypothetical protein